MDTRLIATAEQVSHYILSPRMPTQNFFSRFEFISARWCLLPPAVVALLRGARHTYEVFDWVWMAVSVLVVLRVMPRYWGTSSRVLISQT